MVLLRTERFFSKQQQNKVIS